MVSPSFIQENGIQTEYYGSSTITLKLLQQKFTVHTDASYRRLYGENFSGYGIWISEDEYQSDCNLDWEYDDPNSTFAELRAILVALYLASTKNQWWGNKRYLEIVIRTDCDACIQLLSEQSTTHNVKCEFIYLFINNSHW